MAWSKAGARAWDWRLLGELARALEVDEKTIQRNVRHLVEGLGASALDREEPGPAAGR